MLIALYENTEDPPPPFSFTNPSCLMCVMILVAQGQWYSLDFVNFLFVKLFFTPGTNELIVWMIQGYSGNFI